MNCKKKNTIIDKKIVHTRGTMCKNDWKRQNWGNLMGEMPLLSMYALYESVLICITILYIQYIWCIVGVHSHGRGCSVRQRSTVTISRYKEWAEKNPKMGRVGVLQWKMRSFKWQRSFTFRLSEGGAWGRQRGGGERRPAEWSRCAREP